MKPRTGGATPRVGRRTALRAAAALALPAFAAGSHARVATADRFIPARLAATQATPGPASSPPLIGYAFNSGTKDVTLFDPVTREVLATKPLGAVVRWLSNEQRFWDGRYIWSYDFPDNAVQALAVDPRTVTIARRLAGLGTGPAHSLMLTPDGKTAWLNAAGDNALVALDLASGEVAAEVKTGAFP